MKRILTVAVISSLATGAVIAATGIAQSGSGTDDKPPPTMKQAQAEHEKQRDAHLARIAKRLDVSTDKLTEALEKVRSDELDEAVAEGRLTAAQRDAIKACKAEPLTCDRSNLPAFRGHGKPGGPGARGARRGRPSQAEMRRMRNRFRAERTEFFQALAKELGKDADDVQKAFEAERPRFRRGARGPGGPGGPPHGGPPGGPGGPGGPGFGGPGPGGP